MTIGRCATRATRPDNSRFVDERCGAIALEALADKSIQCIPITSELDTTNAVVTSEIKLK